MNTFVATFFLFISVFGLQFANAKDASAAQREAAEKGDANAQLEYGKSLQEHSRSEAAKWIQKAADQGSGEAWFLLGYAGLGKLEPVFYYEKAAERIYAKAFSPLFDALIFRAGPKADVAKAKKFADLARQKNVEIGYGSAETFRVIDRCYEAGEPKIPSADFPTESEKKNFRNSAQVCGTYIEGIDQDVDHVKFRKCLLSQEEQDNVSLAEVYANGWGVLRNANLAIALICRGSSVPAELQGMVGTLHATKDQARLTTDFAFCDHVTSGLNSGFCAANAEKIADKRRGKELGNIMKNWTEPQRLAFFKLRTVAKDFFDESSTSEHDLSGSGRAQFIVDAQAELRQDFLGGVKAFEDGKWPEENVDFQTADKELNVVYSKIMKRQDFEREGTVTKEGIRATQKKWLRYRDEWVKFASMKYPQVPSET
ncbi:MAG: DUF1311 domain-containing protein [Deltaproteobacteria bacterium]|nr:DUF1311 domain-containing protein [Deltaproteobacteria bacterium]